MRIKERQSRFKYKFTTNERYSRKSRILRLPLMGHELPGILEAERNDQW